MVLEQSPEREIMALIFDHPTTEFHFREIERRTSLSIGTVSKYVRRLEEKGLLKTKERGNLKLAKGNREDPRFAKLKRNHNLSRLEESGLTEHVKKNLRPNALIVFGSYSQGTDTEESDVDLAVLGGRGKKLDLKEFEERLDRSISVTRAERPDEDFLSSLANGIVLEGYLEVK